MRMEIENPQKLELDDFIVVSLLPEIKRVFRYALDRSRLQPIQDYLDVLYSSNNTLYTTDLYNLLIEAIDCITYRKLPDFKYIVIFDYDEKLSYISAKIIDIINLVEYGTLSSPAYPIFSDVFTYILDHIDEIYQNYIGGNIQF